MTPSARFAAAIDVLQHITNRLSAEKALTHWSRANRYAGSKDRAAVRDHVFDVLRQRRSLAHLGGGDTPRALVLGLLRQQKIDPETVFGAGGYSPSALSSQELDTSLDPPNTAAQLDLPDWLWPVWHADLGDQARQAAVQLQSRAPISLRVNLRRGTRAAAIDALAADGIVTIPSDEVKTGLQVIENERRLRLSSSFCNGLVELQDIASQRAVAGLGLCSGSRVLDYCAGGGGKALALADMHDVKVFAHDIASARTVDILPRAARAKIPMTVLTTEMLASHGPFDMVFCDAPCSGSGTWRRTPEAKWAFTSEKMNDFNKLQGSVLADASGFVGPGGLLVYATCSVLSAENEDVVDRFLAQNAGWRCVSRNLRVPDSSGDGFYYCVLQRE